jgi:hypothetical protein
MVSHAHIIARTNQLPDLSHFSAVERWIEDSDGLGIKHVLPSLFAFAHSADRKDTLLKKMVLDFA